MARTVDELPPFRFPRSMPKLDAERLLAEAYAELDEGKILRRTNKLLRAAGIDPPMDVQYVAQPVVERRREGLGVSLGPDILVYNEFPELDDCVEAFETALRELLAKRLERKVRSWRRRDLE